MLDVRLYGFHHGNTDEVRLPSVSRLPVCHFNCKTENHRMTAEEALSFVPMSRLGKKVGNCQVDEVVLID